MPEIKRPVRTIEINYVCDKCNNGMLQKIANADPETGDTPHECVICGHRQHFKWVSYPRIDYIGEGEKL